MASDGHPAEIDEVASSAAQWSVYKLSEPAARFPPKASVVVDHIGTNYDPFSEAWYLFNPALIHRGVFNESQPAERHIASAQDGLYGDVPISAGAV